MRSLSGPKRWRNGTKRHSDKKIQKGTNRAEKDLKRLKRRRFVCVPDAEIESRLWNSMHPYHRHMNLQISPIAEKVVKRKRMP